MDKEEAAKAEVEKRRRIYNATHQISTPSNVPDFAHFAVLNEASMTYDDGYGDPRSGPSYSTMRYMEYIFFDSEEALSAWVIENNGKKVFRVVNVKPVEVELKTSIRFKED